MAPQSASRAASYLPACRLAEGLFVERHNFLQRVLGSTGLLCRDGDAGLQGQSENQQKNHKGRETDHSTSSRVRLLGWSHITMLGSRKCPLATRLGAPDRNRREVPALPARAVVRIRFLEVAIAVRSTRGGSAAT